MTGTPHPLQVALIGFGAIGQALARQLKSDGRVCLTQIIARSTTDRQLLHTVAELASEARLLCSLDLAAPDRPDLVVECAGHSAVEEHVVPALQAGIACVMASVGALHDEALYNRVEAAAAQGHTRVQLVAGAIGGIDALAAGMLGGLDEVTYVGRKPPLSWLGTPAEKVCDLHQIQHPQVIFQGSARQAAHEYPKNANVAATVSLAGLGLDRTRVELIADPGVTRNVHTLVARGQFGQMELTLENLPLATNPKTSALTVYSLARAVRNAAASVVI